MLFRLSTIGPSATSPRNTRQNGGVEGVEPVSTMSAQGDAGSGQTYRIALEPPGTRALSQADSSIPVIFAPEGRWTEDWKVPLTRMNCSDCASVVATGVTRSMSHELTVTAISSAARGSRTTILPTWPSAEWSEQLYLNSPTDGKVCEYVHGAAVGLPLVKLASSATTLCVPATFFQVTVSPAWIVRYCGSKSSVGLSVTVTTWSTARSVAVASTRTEKAGSIRESGRRTMRSPLSRMAGDSM